MHWIVYVLVLLFVPLSLFLLASHWAARAELKRTKLLFDVGLQLNATIKKKELVKTIMETVAEVTQSEGSSVILVDPQKGDLYFEVATGEKEHEVKEIRLAFGEGIAGMVAETGKSVIVNDVSKDANWSNRVATKVGLTTRNLLCVPIMNYGEITGVLQVINKKQGKPYTVKDMKLLEAIASPTAIALENAHLYEALEYSMQVLKETTAEKERMASELKIAAEIQRTFLPKNLPVFADEAVQLYATLQPAREIGGDFFDFYYIDQDHLFFTLGDVSDKGIPAALFMVLTITLLRGKIAPHMMPGQLLKLVNEELCRDEAAMFATIFCGVLHVRTGELHYSDGGHCTPYVIGADGVIKPLPLVKRIPIGVFSEVEYVSQSVTLAPGERLMLYSDGITEAENTTHELFGSNRLISSLQAHHKLDNQQLVEQLLSDVERFSQGAAQADDIAVLVVSLRNQ